MFLKGGCLCRVPEYSPEQMIWAQERAQVLRHAEGAMAAFIQAGPSEQRTALGMLSRGDREQVHQLAGEYGLVTQSIGNGAQRNLMLYKPQNSGLAAGSTIRVPRSLLLPFHNHSFVQLLPGGRAW